MQTFYFLLETVQGNFLPHLGLKGEKRNKKNEIKFVEIKIRKKGHKRKIS